MVLLCAKVLSIRKLDKSAIVLACSQGWQCAVGRLPSMLSGLQVA